jgi:Carboxypeptidase regulatory-like domain
VRQRRVAEADADGKFVVENLPVGAVELHLIAWKTDAGPLDMRLMIPEEPNTIERDFALPAGLILTGRVVDEDAGSGIGGAELIYRPRPEPGRVPSYFGFLTKTEPDGRFRLVVPAGRGSLEVWKLPPSYPNPLSYATGLNANTRLKREFSGKPGETVQDLTFRLDRGKSVTLTVLDPEGRPVAGAEVHRRGRTSQNETPTRTDAAGRCELTGLSGKMGSTVDVVHPALPLGARVVIRPDDPDATKAGRAIEVKLERTASLTGRVVDDEGKPIVDPLVFLHSDVQYPERLGTTVATATNVRADGSFSFDRLLAGANYSVYISANGHASLYSEHIRANADEFYRPKEFRLPAADQELHGVVVDPRGQPVVGATVGFQRTADRQLTAPRSGKWFQQTDGQGRFHLTSPPKGLLTLMAYRNPQGADRSIRNMVRVDAQAGGQGNVVRIVLPDPNERLRGIE